MIQDRTACLAEEERILSDNEYYTNLSTDPSPKFQKECTTLITDALKEQIITKKREKDFLTIVNPNPALYYHLPKVHKDVKNFGG